MKIAFVISTFPPRIGGMGQVALNQALGLVRLGHEITVFTLDYGVRLPESNLKIEYLSAKIRLGDAGFVPQLLSKLRGFDLVHLHFPFYGASFMVLLASMFYHVPYVATYHMDAQPKGIIKNIIKFFSDRLGGILVLKKAKKVILVDQSVEQFSLIKNVDVEKVVKINNAIDTEIFSKKIVSATELGLASISNKKILLFVGNLMPIKRLDLVLEAMNKLTDPDFVLIVVGGGYEEGMYRTLTQDLSLQDQVYFVGQINNPQTLSKYYSLAQVTVVASDYESFSLVALESMACATPVIGSRISELQNKIEVGVNGLTFTQGSSDDLMKKIKEFFGYHLEQRQAMGQQGRGGVINKFSLDKNLQDLVKVYESII
ncbi:MAG: glycosyltransferase family 4 protein [Candidatus Magasanikbacteria bacterium]|nr:glycosyltransferase family 4 protein [Candidatus Magasanikbacteria bacterium]